MAVAVADIPAGTDITDSDVQWVDAPVGLLPSAEFPATLARPVPAGAPVTAFDVIATTPRFPADWLLIELEVPWSTRDGAPIVAVVATDGGTTALAGIVAREPTPSDFGTYTALIAFAPENAITVAAALLVGDVTVLLGR